MIKTIYRGYDITADENPASKAGTIWRVYSPTDNRLISAFDSEEEAQSFIDTRKKMAAIGVRQ